MYRDIAHCVGGDCKIKEFCLRYKAPAPDEYQTYWGTPPMKENGECEYFMSMSCTTSYGIKMARLEFEESINEHLMGK